MKFKFFWFRGPKIENAERELNGWLGQQGERIEIVEIKQSVTGSFLTPPNFVVSIWYKERKDGTGQ